MTDDGWEARMAERARQRRGDEPPRVDRTKWPVPTEIRSASARDAFLWYVADGWQKIFGATEPVEVVFDHDFGYHVLRKGSWQLELVDLEQFPSCADDADVTDPMATAENRIRATFLLDTLDAVLEGLPEGCRPLDPAVCGHPEDGRKRYRDGRLQCLDCGLLLARGAAEADRG